MNNEKVVCEECRDYVPYTATWTHMTATLRGKKYEYMGREAHCSVCGAFVYVPEIEDDNLEALYTIYRAENNIIPLRQVREIPDKYAIGKRPLSLLLGWGELTYSRYMDGDVPSRQYSDMLQRIYDDPAFYAELLEANKDRLPSQKTYEKSRAAVDALLAAMETPPDTEIGRVIQYLLHQCDDITPLALQKGLYYIQGFYYAFHGAYLFEDNCQAWVHGPVYREIYERYRDYHYDPIAPVKEFDTSLLSAEEKAICDSVIRYLCCYSGYVLERFTHKEMPWLRTRGDLPDGDPSTRIIKKELIGEYFCAVRDKYQMVNPGDIRKYAEDMFAGL